jgi:hypothetical protein
LQKATQEVNRTTDDANDEAGGSASPMRGGNSAWPRRIGVPIAGSVMRRGDVVALRSDSLRHKLDVMRCKTALPARADRLRGDGVVIVY